MEFPPNNQNSLKFLVDVIFGMLKGYGFWCRSESNFVLTALTPD